jgi:hypothetical protein
MIVSFDRSFQKSIDKISDPLAARQIEKLIQKIITISSICHKRRNSRGFLTITEYGWATTELAANWRHHQKFYLLVLQIEKTYTSTSHR